VDGHHIEIRLFGHRPIFPDLLHVLDRIAETESTQQK